jgi:hypothetical protein
MPKRHRFPANPGKWMVCTHASSVLIKCRVPHLAFFSLHSYIIRNAKKWRASKMAIPEDSAITAYVVSSVNIPSAFWFSVWSGADAENSPF